MTNPAIEAVRELLDEWENGTPDQVSLLTGLVIAAALDNLPRAVMAEAIADYEGRPLSDRYRAMTNTAIAAARATLLPGDAT